MTNIFPYRATDPKVMKKQFPFSEKHERTNRYLITHYNALSDITIACWGTHGSYKNREHIICEILKRYPNKVHCLGKTKNKHPKHPLYLRADTEPLEYIAGRER